MPDSAHGKKSTGAHTAIALLAPGATGLADSGTLAHALLERLFQQAPPRKLGGTLPVLTTGRGLNLYFPS